MNSFNNLVCCCEASLNCILMYQGNGKLNNMINDCEPMNKELFIGEL